MMAEMIFYWLKQSDCRMTASRRKVLLLIDDCSAHGSSGAKPNLESVADVYLPPTKRPNINLAMQVSLRH